MELRKENAALEKIVLQKERQLQAISEVENVNSDIGALQLGEYELLMFLYYE